MKMKFTKRSIVSLAIGTIIALNAVLLVVEPALDVEAAGYKDMYQYVNSQSFLGDGSEIYYKNLTWENSRGYTSPVLTPTKNYSNKRIGYYIADINADGKDELITLNVSANYEISLSISELVNNNVEEKDSVVVPNINGALEEDGNINCFVYNMNGITYIGVEHRTITSRLANGTGMGLFSYIYDNNKLSLKFKDEWAGSSYDDSEDNPNGVLDQKIKEAGVNCRYETLVSSDINTYYSDYIQGSKKVCGYRQRVMYEGYDVYPKVIMNYTKETFYNLGNTNPVTDGTMYRMYNKNNGEHFYTGNNYEKSSLICSGWDYEGLAWKAPLSSKAPVYRLYNPNTGDHHYTTNGGEKDMLESVGWNYEGIGWYSADSGTPLLRLYNPNATGAGSHHYTTSVDERNGLVSIGWKDEGIGWYGL